MNKIGHEPSVKPLFPTGDETPETIAKTNAALLEKITKRLPTKSPSLVRTIARAARSELPFMIFIGAMSPLLGIAYERLTSPSSSLEPIPESNYSTHSSHHPKENPATEKASLQISETTLPPAVETPPPSSHELEDLFSEIGYGAT